MRDKREVRLFVANHAHIFGRYRLLNVEGAAN